jgi:2-polyprenyl-3-methyl-5-hydroxy-6-metoxy-1,4-benzoquinol methylase
VAADEVMKIAGRMLNEAGAVGALAARLRLEDLDAPADPELLARLDAIAECVGLREFPAGLDAGERSIVIGFARAFLTFALDLIDDPARPPGWSFSDPAMLRSIGAGSAVIASLLAGANIGRPDMRVLDVGAGVGALSMAFARTYPDSRVVGLEPWEPSRAIATASVAAADLEARVAFVPHLIEEYDDADGFDLVWLPGPFLHDAILDAALARSAALTRPDGWVVLGTFGATGDPLADAVANVRTVRFGGTVLSSPDAIARMERAGLRDVREIERVWNAPVGLVVGCRA